MKALLIIDMQCGSFTPATPRYDDRKVIAHINALSERFRQQQDRVLYIQHDGTAHGDYLPGSEEWALLPELDAQPEDLYISKMANDCFYRSELQATLQQADITEIVITGCATDFCVDATVKSAYAKDYQVTVIADGHTTADREGIEAAKLIGHYNWIWQNMLPVASGSLRVLSCAGYLSLP